MINTVLLLLVLLNLLIAVMGDTFDRVKETSDNNTKKELVSMMNENEILIRRKAVFKNAKYIIVINEETAEEV